MAEIFSGAPPKKPGPQTKILQLKAGERIDGVILSEKIWGVVTHWNDGRGKKGRSQRCTQLETGECIGCSNQLPARWKGYLYILDFLRKGEMFVELTQGAAEKVGQEVGEHQSLRGLRVKANRTPGGNTGRLLVEISLWPGDREKLPQEKNPEPILEELWSW